MFKSREDLLQRLSFFLLSKIKKVYGKKLHVRVEDNKRNTSLNEISLELIKISPYLFRLHSRGVRDFNPIHFFLLNSVSCSSQSSTCPFSVNAKKKLFKWERHIPF